MGRKATEKKCNNVPSPPNLQREWKNNTKMSSPVYRYISFVTSAVALCDTHLETGDKNCRL